ncbi:hypothetical protein MNV49_003221 [Pseudohyphozyma bogoriensis]|nr:hypothetical protein MNV49_003221 [Pseudohyphozyma bogoriensis]
MSQPHSLAPLHPSSLATLFLVLHLTSLESPHDSLLELVLTSIYEDDRPKSLHACVARIVANDGASVASQKTARELQEHVALLLKGGLDVAHGWLTDLRGLYPLSDEDEVPPSFPTLYVRRSLLSFAKLSFDAAVHWWTWFEKWCEGTWVELDSKSKRIKTGDLYRKARLGQDYQMMRDAMSYYDFDEMPSIQNKTQYALLNAAFLEYEMGGLQAARDAFPAPSLVTLLYTSRALYQTPSNNNLSKDKVSRLTTWNDRGFEPVWHITAGLLWEELGSVELSTLRERIALDATDMHVINWSFRLPLLARRANKLTQTHRFDDALQLLLKAVDSRGKRKQMGVLEFRTWETCVWDVVMRRAEVRGAKSVVDFVKKVAPPPANHWTVKGFTVDEEVKNVEELFDEGCKHLADSQPVSALPLLLQALHRATLSSSERLRLFCVCKLVDCRLAVSPTVDEAKRSLRELEADWSSFLRVGRRDREVLARARESKARAVLIVAGVQEGKGKEGGEGIDEARELVKSAYETFYELGSSVDSLRLLSLLARLYGVQASSAIEAEERDHWIKERNTAAANYLEERKRASEESEEEWSRVRDVQAVVACVERAVMAGLAVV